MKLFLNVVSSTASMRKLLVGLTALSGASQVAKRKYPNAGHELSRSSQVTINSIVLQFLFSQAVVNRKLSTKNQTV